MHGASARLCLRQYRGRHYGAEGFKRKTVGGTNFQPASNIWMRGILEEHYGLKHRSITWLVDRSEDIPFTPPPGLRIEIEEFVGSR